MAYTITVFGDSITFGACDGVNGGWCGRLKRYFEPKGTNHRLYNLGICGDTSRGVLERLEVEAKARIKFKRESDRHIAIFAIGINDSYIDLNNNQASVDINEFKINIETLIKKAKNHTKEIIFISSIPVDEELCLNWESRKYNNERAQNYNNIIEELCNKNNILFFNIFHKFSELNYRDLLEDGLHPNPEGYEKMYELIKDFLISNKIID